MHFSTYAVVLIIAVVVFSSVPLSCPLSSRNYVDHLPGFHGTLPFRMETGYITVDEAKGTEFFYYFVESERAPRKDPVLLWLSGGPGCSSFLGFSQENGPVIFKFSAGSASNLTYNQHAWTKISSIIYLDWPSGTGFSYSKRKSEIILDDVSTTNQIYYFLQQWFLDHPKFRWNPFYVLGESYGGKVAALVTHKIMKGNERAKELINLEGFFLASPRTGEDKYDINSRVPRAHQLGIISDELFESIQRDCVGEDYIYPMNPLCQANIREFNKFLDEIWLENILEPRCGFEGTLKEFPQFIYQDVQCPVNINHHITIAWENDNLTRTVLGVKEGTVEKWMDCNHAVNNSYSEDIPSSLPLIFDLLSHGYRALVYSGDHDMVFPLTREWIQAFNFTTIEHWRSWHVNGQVAGYTEAYSSNLTFATVLGAGHEAAQDRPAQCRAMFERWITHKPL